MYSGEHEDGFETDIAEIVASAMRKTGHDDRVAVIGWPLDPQPGLLYSCSITLTTGRKYVVEVKEVTDA